MSLTVESFYKGMTTDEHLREITLNREPILKIFEAVEVSPEAKAFFDQLPQPLRVAVFTEEWCADCVTTTPTLQRLTESTDGLEARVFKRDQHRELTDSFLPSNRQGTLPVFVVFDAQMQEVASFIETAKELVPLLQEMEHEVRRTVATPSETDKPFGEMEEASRTAVRRGRYAYRVARAREWGYVVIQAFTGVVRAGLALPAAQRPAVDGTEWPPPQPQ